MAYKIVIEQGVPNKPITVKVESDNVDEAVNAANLAINSLNVNSDNIVTLEENI